MKLRNTPWLTGAAASVALLMGGLAAHAQDTDDAAPPPPPVSSTANAPSTAPDADSTTPSRLGGTGLRRAGRGGRGFTGQVASVSSTGFTYTARRSNQTVTVSTTSTTTYAVTHDGSLSDIKIGDNLTLFGPVDTAGKTVQAGRITDGTTLGFGNPRQNRGGTDPMAMYMVHGTVVLTSPLKVKNAQGVVYTVTPMGQSSDVTFTAAGALSDVQVGKYVTIRPQNTGANISPDSTSITAANVIVSPTAPRMTGGRGFQRPGG